MSPMSQTEWHKLAGRIERVIYADNAVAPFGTDLRTASLAWLRKHHPAVSPTLRGLFDALAFHMGSKTRRIQSNTVEEAWHVLRRWRHEPEPKELSVTD